MRPRSLAVCLCALAFAAGGCHRRQPPPGQGAAAPGSRAGAPAAPGAPGAPGAGAPENLACKLLGKDDAETVLGGPVLEPPVTSNMADVGMESWRCGYISEAKEPTRVVTLLVSHWQDAATARRAFERAHSLSQSVSGQVPETVDGLGERAYWAGGKVNQLNVLAGHDWLVISDTVGPNLDQLGPARLAAARILAHH